MYLTDESTDEHHEAHSAHLADIAHRLAMRRCELLQRIGVQCDLCRPVRCFGVDCNCPECGDLGF